MRLRPPTAPAWLRERPIAHRGLHDDVLPENSLAAMEAAARAGYPVEIDVHRTRDGEVVVFHDDDLERMTGARGRVEHKTAGELVSLRLGDTDEHVPLLGDVLDTIAARVPVLIELKTHGGAGRLEPAVLSVLRGYAGEVALQSFDPLSMVWFRRVAPRITRGLLASDFEGASLPAYKKFLLRHLLLAPLVVPSFIAYDLRSLPSWPATLARSLGLPLLAWTIRDEADAVRAARLADNVIFEGVRL